MNAVTSAAPPSPPSTPPDADDRPLAEPAVDNPPTAPSDRNRRAEDPNHRRESTPEAVFAHSPRDEAIEFVLAIGLALHKAGTPAHRIEDVMARVSETYGLKGAFFSTPTSLHVTFDGRPPSTVLMRTTPGENNLGRLADIDVIAQAAAEGLLPPREGLRQLSTLDAFVESRDAMRWTKIAPAVAGAFVSGAAARLLGGGANDILCATILGIVVAIIGTQFSQRDRFAHVSDLVATVACVIGAHALSHVVGLRVEVVALAGVIVLVPGFTLTVALTELATKHLVSGTARLCAAAITFLQITVGYAAGTRLGATFGPETLAPSAALPAWTDVVAVVIASLGAMLLMKARITATGWIVAGAALAVYTAKFLGPTFGPELAAGAAATALGAFANAYSRLRKRPASEVLSPGVILLVPGSIGFVSLRALLQSDVLAGVQGAFLMTMVGASIVVGLLTANAIIEPRRLL